VWFPDVVYEGERERGRGRGRGRGREREREKERKSESGKWGGASTVGFVKLAACSRFVVECGGRWAEKEHILQSKKSEGKKSPEKGGRKGGSHKL
jgi:hypothetical protein